jgi:hypothetical protein
VKLWREEVSPRIDLVLDHTPSMELGTGKGHRTWELTYFTIESALASGGQIRIVRLARGAAPEEIDLDRARAHAWPAPRGAATASAPLLADELRRVYDAQAAVTARADSHRRPPLQAHHALRSAEERVHSGTCCVLYAAATIAVTKCVVDGRRR